jgi:hypothetical protein
MDVMRQTNPQLSQASTAESEAFELKVPGVSLSGASTLYSNTATDCLEALAQSR